MTIRRRQMIARNTLLVVYSMIRCADYVQADAGLSMLYHFGLRGVPDRGIPPLPWGLVKQHIVLNGGLYALLTTAMNHPEKVDLPAIGARINRIGQLFEINFWHEWHAATGRGTCHGC